MTSTAIPGVKPLRDGKHANMVNRVGEPRLSSILVTSISEYPGALRRLFLIALPAGILIEGLATFVFSDMSTDAEFAWAVGGAAAVFALAVLAAALMTLRQLKASFRYYGSPVDPILGITVRMTLWLTLGVVLFVPAIIMAIIWIVAIPALFLQRTQPKEAMQLSRELVRGRWPMVIGILLIVSGIPTIMGFIPELLGYSISSPASLATRLAVTTLSMPFAVVVSIVLYDALDRAPRPA